MPAFFFVMHKRLVSKELPNSLPRQFRAMPVQRQAQPEGADPNRFAFALSSEQPVDQWFGREVLSHDKKAIRQDRLKAGIPLLFNHNRDQHLGVIDGYSITDGVLRVEGKWSSSAFAQEKKRDFDDGILKDSSIGYDIHHVTRDQAGDCPSENDTLNVDDWEPMEGSLVTIPADFTVGKGRSADAGSAIPLAVDVVRRELPKPAAPAAIPTYEVRMAETANTPSTEVLEQQRRDAILAIASDKDFSRYASTAEVREAFDKGTSAADFSQMVSRKIVAANDANKVGTAGSNVVRELGNDAKRYSLARAFRAAINDHKSGTFNTEDATIEREVAAEIRKRSGISGGNMVVPNAIVSRMPSERAGTTTTQTATGAGYAAQSALLNTITESELIEMYRNRARVLALGASRLGGLSGVVRLPRQTGAGTAQWVAETGTTNPSSITTDFVALTPKRLTMQSIYTIELLAQSAVDVEGTLAKDRAKVLNLAVDLGAISGPGTGGAPTGILNTTGLALVTPSGATLTAGKTLGYLDTLQFESLIAQANADVLGMGWLVTPEVRAILKATPKFTNAIAAAVWDAGRTDPDGLQDGPEGYRAGITNQLPKNGGAGTNLHTAIFGDWSQLIVADWGASELIVDPYTQAGSGAFVVTERSLMDIQVRHVQAFAAATAIAIS